MSQFRAGLCFAVPLLLLTLILSVAGVSAVRASTCQDLDGDGYGYPGDATCPAGPEEDCDDGNATVYPGAPEFCDGLNNDCRDAHWPTLRTFAASNISTAADGAVSVFAADVDGDGDSDVLSASRYDDTIAWYENVAGDGTAWTEHVISTAADGAWSVFAADVDGDGDVDALSASVNDDKVAWYENVTGDGSAWTERVISTAADRATSVFAVDVDGDGDTDALSASNQDDKIAWYENVAGDGSAWTEHLISTAADGAASVFAADVDGDGDADALSASAFDDTIAWYENVAGDGSAWTEHLISTSADGARSVFAADVDGDGHTDVLSASVNDDKIAWYENRNGRGTVWKDHVISTSADGAVSVFAADVDGDGDTDALSASESDHTIAWYENVAGDGTAWTEHAISTAAEGALSVFAADVDGDGVPDALSASRNDDKIVWYSQGTIEFDDDGDGLRECDGDCDDVNPDTYPGAPEICDGLDNDCDSGMPASEADADLDGFMICEGDCDDANAHCTTDCTDADLDGWCVTTDCDESNAGCTSDCADADGDGFCVPSDCDDLAGSVYPGAPEICDGLFNDCDHPQWPVLWLTWEVRDITTTANEAGSIFAADIDGDGDTDALWGGHLAHGYGGVAWHENTSGDGMAWTEHVIWTEGSSYSVLAADMDGDGDADGLSASGYYGVQWHENTSGDGTAWTEHYVGGYYEAMSAFAVDMDGDGDLDALAGGWGNPSWIAWYENTSGDGTTWTEHLIWTTSNDYVNAVSAADVDGDGDPDVLSGTEYHDTVSWHENTAGDGTAWIQHTIAEAGDVMSVVAADMDGDGDPDSLSASSYGVSWHENAAGDGTAWTTHWIRSLYHMSAVAADIDGDGDLDALSAAWYGEGIAWHENRSGDGLSWRTNVLSPPIDTATSVFAADLDGDGRLDPLSATGTIAWYRRLGNIEHEDNDGDGLSECAGDCDDGNPDTFPGAPEICDGLDNDCVSGVPAVEHDADLDGFMVCEGDCADAVATVYPEAPQICDGVNNDCDHPSWPGLTNTNDGDDDGDTYSECGGDCDDTRAHCTTDCTDADLDGWCITTDCDDGVAAVYPAAPQICDGLNNDCDHPSWPGIANTTESDDDGDTLSECAGDCDDGNANCTTDCTDGDGDGVYVCAGDCDDTRAHCTTDCTDADLDGWCITTDCDDTNPLALSVPVEVSGLEAEEIPGGVRLTWESQAATAGAGTVYDLFSGLVLDLSSTGGDFSTGACFGEDLGDPLHDYLGPAPPLGDALYFMVRGQNACPGGTGTYGTANRDATAALSPSPCN